MNEEIKISKLVQQALDRINKGNMSYENYLSMYNNVQDSEKITDYEKEILTDKLVGILRIKYPRQSARILGNKSVAAQEILEEFLAELKKEFNWKSNKVKPNVKPGGSMIGGREFVCWYISYKNSKDWTCGLAYIQKTADEHPYLEINKREVKKNSKFEPISKKYIINNKQEAFEDYKLHLVDIIE